MQKVSIFFSALFLLMSQTAWCVVDEENPVAEAGLVEMVSLLIDLRRECTVTLGVVDQNCSADDLKRLVSKCSESVVRAGKLCEQVRNYLRYHSTMLDDSDLNDPLVGGISLNRFVVEVANSGGDLGLVREIANGVALYTLTQLVLGSLHSICRTIRTTIRRLDPAFQGMPELDAAIAAISCVGGH